MNPDPGRFYDTAEAATLAHMSEHGLRKILRGKKDGSKTLLAHRIEVNRQPRYFIEKWVFHIWLQNEIGRLERHAQRLRQSLNNTEARIQNDRTKT